MTETKQFKDYEKECQELKDDPVFKAEQCFIELGEIVAKLQANLEAAESEIKLVKKTLQTSNDRCEELTRMIKHDNGPILLCWMDAHKKVSDERDELEEKCRKFICANQELHKELKLRDEFIDKVLTFEDSNSIAWFYVRKGSEIARQYTTARAAFNAFKKEKQCEKS